MSKQIELTDPQANDILVWSDIGDTFINVKPSPASLNLKLPEYKITSLSPVGYDIIQRISGDHIYTRSITGGDGITLTDDNGVIEISTDSLDATTLGGHEPEEFLRVENQLNEIDNDVILDRLDVYTKGAAHDEFMEANASNVPDADNAYDLGANGRRYADIFALTFHGTATYALVAGSLANKGADDGDVLIWRTDVQEWVPEDVLGQYLKTEGLQILPQYGERIFRPTSPSFNVSVSNVFEYTFKDNEPSTIEFIAPSDDNLYSVTVILRNADNADFVWPSTLKWIGMDQEPDRTPKDIYTFFTIDGVNWLGSYAGSVE